MRGLTFVLVALLSLSVLIGCSEKKTEAEYFQMAYDHYNKEAYPEAITNFKNILEYYPQGDNAPKATFMIGFIYANNTKDLEEAKKYYTLFIEKYPEHDLADDAKYELETLGQDINDLPMFKDTEAE
ncbi:MAG: outer membrane protein assembly factor BamD [Calditrichales bacterium]|nr:MAG: outer membrane protein assembly factor BamD [Calditrichales bacterium]